ncbi:MAG: ComF family protein [Candidatus Binatia bacterium]
MQWSQLKCSQQEILSALRGLAARCPGCGTRDKLELCSRCAGTPFRRSAMLTENAAPPLARVRYVCGYNDANGAPCGLAVALKHFKYDDDRRCGRRIARFFGARMAAIEPVFDLVVPVPLHRSRLLARGFNQSAWLALAAGKSMGLRCAPLMLSRRGRSGSQASLRTRRNRRLLRGEFLCRRKLVHSPRVLLVDDVMTSGATARDAAAALRDAGAASVELAVLMRSFLPSSRSRGGQQTAPLPPPDTRGYS